MIKFWTDARRAALELFRFPLDQWTYLFSSHQYQITSPFMSKIKKKKCSPFRSQESLPPRIGYIDPIKGTPGADSDFIRVCPEPTIWVGSAIITVEVRGKNDQLSFLLSGVWWTISQWSTWCLSSWHLPQPQVARAAMGLSCLQINRGLGRRLTDPKKKGYSLSHQIKSCLISKTPSFYKWEDWE